MPQNTDVTNDYIPALDGLRAMSIILVMTGHMISQVDRPFWLRILILHSRFGVSVFFVISGFPITRLLLNEKADTGTISLLLFYARRALRILPAFVLFVGTVAVLSYLGITPIAADVWRYVFTYTVNICPADPTWPLVHLWSLSVEEQFYTGWPLLLKLVDLRTSVAIAVLVVFSAIPTQALHTLFGLNFSHLSFPYVSAPIALGSLLAMTSRRFSAFLKKHPVWADGRMAVALILAMFVTDAIPNTFGLLSALLVVFLNGLLTFFVATVIFIPTGTVAVLLSRPQMVWLGKISYSLYLWQELFLRPAPDPAPIPLQFPANLLAAFAAALTSYYGVEIRFDNWRKSLRANKRISVLVET